METKYQIFVSSTFADLQSERQSVARAILSLGHLPAGLEFFPSSGEEQLKYIKQVIDICDYYVIIIGGRYGSVDDEGISFTEREYEYAVERDIPILAFLHEDIELLPHGSVEKDQSRLQRLQRFQHRVKSNRLVSFWNNSGDLESKVIVSLTHAMQDKPQVGWRRGDQGPSREVLDRINELSRDRDAWRKLYSSSSQKLKRYEELTDANITILVKARNSTETVVFSAEEIIRHFAARLNRGLVADEINFHMSPIIEQRLEHNEFELDESAADNILLFFEVFEIVDVDSDFLTIREDKKHLLKTAFVPLRQVKGGPEGGLDDEIPF